jgi:hypothetical protein
MDIGIQEDVFSAFWNRSKKNRGFVYCVKLLFCIKHFCFVITQQFCPAASMCHEKLPFCKKSLFLFFNSKELKNKTHF